MTERNINSASPGIAALTTLLGIGIIISLIGFTLTALAFFEGNLGFSQSKSNQALLIARSGIQDAFLKIEQTPTGGSSLVQQALPYTYSLGLSSGTSTVTISNGSGTNLYVIDSLGAILGRERKVEAVISVDPTTGSVSTISYREVGL